MIATFFYHNERYTLPREDAIAVDRERRLFVAADGVTRDFGGALEGLQPYPDPSPATDAADAVATTSLRMLRDGKGGEDGAREALEVANAAVGDVNTDLGLWERCDYLECDLAGAVAAVSTVQENRLTIGWIGDCGVALVRDGALAFLTRDQLDHLVVFLAANPARYDDARRVYIRGSLRNRPDTLIQGKPITYGVLTGEPEAVRYIETATLDLRPGDVVATHTDGFRPYFGSPEFLAAVSGDPAQWEVSVPDVMRRLIAADPEYGKERSLILYHHES